MSFNTDDYQSYQNQEEKSQINLDQDRLIRWAAGDIFSLLLKLQNTEQKKRSGLKSKRKHIIHFLYIEQNRITLLIPDC